MRVCEQQVMLLTQEPEFGKGSEIVVLGQLGNRISFFCAVDAVLCAAGFNIRRLLRMTTKKGLRASLRALRAMAPTTVRSNQRLTFGWHVARMRLRHHHERPSYAIAAG